MKGLIKKTDNLSATDSGSTIDFKPDAPSQVAEQSSQVAEKPSNFDKMVDATVSNFPKILDLVSDITDIIKTKVKSSAQIAEIEQKRQNLITETKCYIARFEKESNEKLQKMDMVAKMMHDFNTTYNGNLTSSDFCKIITDMIDKW